MIIPKGTPVIATDPDLMDVYNAILAEDWNRGTGRLPACRIQTMIRYPIQHAIAWPEIANDNPPLEEGKVYRLRVVSVREGDSVSRDYASSVSLAREIALRYARQNRMRDREKILLQHEKGNFSRPRRSALMIQM